MSALVGDERGQRGPGGSGGSKLRLLAGLAGIAAAVAALVTLPVGEYLQRLLEWVESLGVWGGVVLAGIYVPAAVALLPGSILTLGAGFLYGVVWGTVIVSVGSTLAAGVSFLIGRKLARGFVESRIERYPRFGAIDKAVRDQGLKIIFLTRLSPVFPYNFLNYAYGLTDVRFRQFIVASWIGMIPGTVMYVYLGSALGSLAQVAAGQRPSGGIGQQILFWGGLAATVVVTVLVTRIARRALRDAAADVRELDQVEAEPTALHPTSTADKRLDELVRPSNWTNPTPQGKYNLVVIGGGAAGLVSAAGGAGLGAKVALVERDLLGGDCLNVGCVPSKALLKSARVAALARRATDYGISVGEVTVDFSKVMERMRELRSQIAPVDSARRFSDLGIDVFRGTARFVADDQIEVDGHDGQTARLQFAKAVIATGRRPSPPPIPGLESVDYLTNETVFNLDELPERLGIIGGGPIGCELAQAFARFGSTVTLFEAADSILPREDPEAVDHIRRALVNDGVTITSRAELKEISRQDEGIVLRDQDSSLTVDALLIAAGRRPNVENLALDRAGIGLTETGELAVDDRLQTTNSRVYGAGDVALGYQFTHAADASARLVLKNALFWGRGSARSLVIPWATYTEPELAQVGLTESAAHDSDTPVDVFRFDLQESDRAILDGEARGFVKVLVEKGSDTILGATIVGAHAGDMISEVAVAIQANAGLSTIADTIHPYPTQTEAVKRVGDAYNRTRLTPRVAAIFEKVMAWQRR